jgi:MraZ protein
MMAFGATEEVPYDSSGRVIIPPMMRRKSGIEDLALFIGVGETSSCGTRSSSSPTRIFPKT